jgi:protein phosphatase
MSSALIEPTKDDSTDEFPVPNARKAHRVGVMFGARTDRGRVRERNEDQFLIAKLAKSMRICGSSLPEPQHTRFADEEGYLMIVADGMGGVAGGEEASAMAVRTVESFVLDAIKWFLHKDGSEQDVLVGELKTALERADRSVVERAEADPELYGMGTTLTMGYSVGTDLFVAHAGDSRAYQFRRGRLERITSDHTLVQMLVDGGVLSPEDARDHPRRHVVTNVLGGPHRGVQVDIKRKEIADGDVLLLCTDGLTEALDEPEIARLLERSADPDRAAHDLVDAALSRDANDNITVVLARYEVK